MLSFSLYHSLHSFKISALIKFHGVEVSLTKYIRLSVGFCRTGFPVRILWKELFFRWILISTNPQNRTKVFWLNLSFNLIKNKIFNVTSCSSLIKRFKISACMIVSEGKQTHRDQQRESSKRIYCENLFSDAFSAHLILFSNSLCYSSLEIDFNDVFFRLVFRNLHRSFSHKKSHWIIMCLWRRESRLLLLLSSSSSLCIFKHSYVCQLLSHFLDFVGQKQCFHSHHQQGKKRYF